LVKRVLAATALPHPKTTKTAVPTNSATYLFLKTTSLFFNNYFVLMNSIAFCKRVKVFSLPKSTITSNIPGLKVLPVKARRVG
jgi:hypothetical protein